MKASSKKVNQRASILDWPQLHSETIWGAIFTAGITLFVLLVLIRRPKDLTLQKHSPQRLNQIDSDLPAPEQPKQSFMALVNLGNTLLAQYKNDAALQHFRAALQLQPNEPSIHFKIGRIFLQKEQHHYALSAFKTALRLNPKLIDAAYEIARIHHLLGETDQLQQSLNNALAIQPNHKETLKLKIKYLEEVEDYAQAVDVLQILIESSHHPLKYQEMQVEFFIEAGQFPLAIETLNGLAQSNPTKEPYYGGQIGQCYFLQKAYSKAIDQFKQVLQSATIEKDPEYAQTIKNQMAASLCNEGVKRYELGDSAGAVHQYQEALLYDSKNADIHYNMGKALTRTQETAKAMRHFESALALNPQDPACYYELAILQDEKGLIQDAIENYKKVIALEPHNAKAYFGLGTLLGVEGKLDEAIQYLSQAIRMEPQYVDAFYNLAVALERKKEINKAIKMYQKVIRLDRNHKKAQSNLTHIQYDKNR